MLKICKTCKQEVNIAVNQRGNMRCSNCNSPQCSFEKDVILKCDHCGREVEVLAGEYVTVLNTCHQALNSTQRALWTIIEVVQNNEPVLEQINKKRIELDKKPIKASVKKVTRRRGRPKQPLLS